MDLHVLEFYHPNTSTWISFPELGKLVKLTSDKIWSFTQHNKRYCLSTVYRKLGYIDVIGGAADHSMRAAAEVVQVSPENFTEGQWAATNECIIHWMLSSDKP